MTASTTVLGFEDRKHVTVTLENLKLTESGKTFKLIVQVYKGP